MAEIRMVVNSFIRTGDSTSAEDMPGFLANTFTMIPKEQIGLIRADSGFSGNKILRELERLDLNYIISRPMKSGLVNVILSQKRWWGSKAKGITYTSF